LNSPLSRIPGCRLYTSVYHVPRTYYISSVVTTLFLNCNRIVDEVGI